MPGEPIRVEEVSFCHTVAEAKLYIDAVDHPGVRHITGDLFHMQTGEPHIGTAILQAGAMFVNLHLADSNRLALGPGGDPYRALNGVPDPRGLTHRGSSTITYFREREEALVSS